MQEDADLGGGLVIGTSPVYGFAAYAHAASRRSGRAAPREQAVPARRGKRPRRTTSTPVKNLEHSTRLYELTMSASRGLDRNRDGIACEKQPLCGLPSIAVARFGATDLLYHYTTREAALGSILPTGRLRLGLLRYMNDPREAKRWYMLPSRVIEAAGYPQSTEELLAFSDRVSESVQGTTKVLSFTTDAPTPADDPYYVFARGWARARMWTHYADGHRGICLVFDARALSKAIRRALRKRGELWHAPVDYEDEALDEFEALRIDYSRIVDVGFGTAVSEHVARHRHALFFRKNTDWASEWEYRWVFRDAQSAPAFVPIRSSLRQVIRGDAFPNAELDAYRHQIERYPDAGEGLLRWMNGGPFLLPGKGSGGLHIRTVV
jgi:hypothetical protein